MERAFVYSGAIPLDTDILTTEKNAYIGLAKLAAAILGTNTLLNGFACTPTSPASLNINVAPGEIYSLQEIDPTAYGDLPSDTSHSIVKQGINLNSTTFIITPPGTVGYSQNYLIEFSFVQQDIDPVVLAYYNPTNPAAPYSGPNNSGAANNTVRSNFVTITALAGTAAPTGTQTTPSPDAGFIGGFIVTVANGQTTITSGNISIYPGAPFITETLLQKISQATADARYAQQTQVQNNSFTYCIDTGTPNAIITNVSPILTSYVAGLKLLCKIANTNTGASTINVNGLGNVNIERNNVRSLFAGDLVINQIAELIYDGTIFHLSNPATLATAPNLVIGGNFSINPWQRGTTFTSPSNQTNTADMFQWVKSGSGAVTITKASDAPTISQAGILVNNCYSVATTTADTSGSSGNYYATRYAMEGYDFTEIAQQSFTISFWVKATVTGIYCIGIVNSGNDRSYVAEYTINNSNTWQYITITIPASPSAGSWNYTNGVGIAVYFTISAGATYQTTAGSWTAGNFIASSNQVNGMSSTSNVFKIDLLQINQGNIVSNPLVLSAAETLLKAQRYYKKSYQQGTDPGTATFINTAIQVLAATIADNFSIGSNPLGTTMRAIPTLTLYSPSTGTSGKIWDVNDAVDLTAATVNVGDSAYVVNNETGTIIADGKQMNWQFTAEAGL